MEIDTLDRKAVREQARRALRLTPVLAEHLHHQVTAPKDKSGGGGGGGSFEASLPFQDGAADALNLLYAMHVNLLTRLGQPVITTGVWRDQAGNVLGGKFGNSTGRGVRVTFLAMTDALRPLVDPVTLLGDPDEATAWGVHARRVFKMATHHPMEPQSEWSPVPCFCGGKVTILPPEAADIESVIVCSQCGRTYTWETLRQTRRIAIEVAKAARRR